MAKNKLEKFADMSRFGHVFQPGLDFEPEELEKFRGNWAKKVFQNENPIILELGCGKGEYTLALARKYPNKNFIGIDSKGARMWRGAKQSDAEGLKNVAFLRNRIEFLSGSFAPGEVEQIWLTFSDPHLKDRKGTKRLTHPIFLNRYQQVLQPGGHIHLKTDSPFLFAYTRGVIDGIGGKLLYTTHDLYGPDWRLLNEDWHEILSVQTFYEKMWLAEGRTIQYLRFQLPETWK